MMRRALVLAFVVLWAWPARAQVSSCRTWQDNECGAGFVMQDVGSVQVDNLTGQNVGVALTDINGNVFIAPTLGFAGQTVLIVDANATSSNVGFQAVNTSSNVLSAASSQLVNDSTHPFAIRYFSVAGGDQVIWVGPASSGGSLITDPFGVGFARAAFATNATGGYPQIPSMPGTPIGVPNVLAGQTPITFDSTHGTLECWNGSWASCNTAGSGSVTSVTGTATQILCTPSSPNPVCSLIATAVTPGSYTNTSLTVDALGRLTAASNGTAPVLSVAGTAQRISVTGGTSAVVDTIGGFYSGAVSGGNEDLGGLATGLLKGTVSAGVSTISTAVAGTDYQAPIAGNTCGSNTFATSISTAGALTCTQPSFSDLAGTMSLTQEPNIAAHTILANATALAAQAAQTSIGTTLEFDGTGQLQCIGLRDGGGVNHVTTGTWGVSSILGTDVSGDLASEAQLACGQLPAFGGDLSSPGGTCTPTVVAIHTSGGARVPIGTFSIGQLLGDVGGSIAGVNTAGLFGSPQSATFVYNYLSTSILGGFGALWAVPGPVNSADTDGNAYEMAVEFVPTAVRIVANVTCNSLSATGYSGVTFQVTQNGTSVTGAVTPALAAGGGCPTPGVIRDSGAIAVTASAGDRWGMLPSGSNTGGGVFSASVTLYVYQ